MCSKPVIQQGSLLLVLPHALVQLYTAASATAPGPSCPLYV